MKLDSHQHFWDYAAHPADYVWMGDGEAALRRDFAPSDLEPLLRAAGYQGSIAVQAREMAVETDDLLAIARDNAVIKGVVGWLDLCSPFVEGDLDRYRDEPLLKGLRMLIHDQPDPDFASSDAHVRGVSLLGARGLTYDLLVRPEHLTATIGLVDRLPNQRFVVDHIAKPALNGLDSPAWRQGVTAIAERPNVWCKLSGLGTLVGAAAGWPGRVAGYLDAVLEAFGPERCMIGSDWPVSTLAVDYRATMSVVEDWCAPLSEGERNAILGNACSAFYGLEDLHGR